MEFTGSPQTQSLLALINHASMFCHIAFTLEDSLLINPEVRVFSKLETTTEPQTPKTIHY